MSEPKQLVLRDMTKETVALLHANEDAESVLVQLDGKASEQECLGLFYTLAGFSRLTSLRVTSLEKPLPVAALTYILGHPSTRIANLELAGITLSGKAQEYLALVEVIRQQSSLEAIELSHCQFAQEKISLDPLLRALSTVPTLQRLSLIGTKIATPSWNYQYLRQLIFQLRSLKLEKMEEIQEEQFAVITEALRDPHCRLKELVVIDQDISGETLESIARVLEVNTSMEDFAMKLNDSDEVVKIAEALSHRKSNIKRLSLPGDWAGRSKIDFYSKTRRALLDMVQTNVNLEDVYLGDNSSATKELQSEMATYVQMNVSSQQELFPSKRATNTSRPYYAVKKEQMRRPWGTKKSFCMSE